MQAEIAQGRLVAVPLRTPGLLRPIGVLHRRRREFNSATQAFLELLNCGDGVANGGSALRRTPA